MEWNRAAKGAAAGLIATAPMTLLIVAAHRLLPRDEQYPMPPRMVTERVSEAVGTDAAIDEEEEKTAATLLSHFGYGAAGGALYSAFAGRTELPRALEGTVYGLLIWVGSYLGWLPALGLMPSVKEQPVRRTVVMVAAHVVYGSVLGTLLQRMQPDESPLERVSRRLHEAAGRFSLR